LRTFVAVAVGGTVLAAAYVALNPPQVDRDGHRPRRIRASYGAEKYERLAGIKTIYDPQNVFRHNVNIPPAS